MLIPRSRSRAALKAATLTGCCSGSVEAIRLLSPLYLPTCLSCRLTGLSETIHHVCNDLTAAVDRERVDECSPVSPSLLWLIVRPLAPWLWPSTFETVDVKACFLLPSNMLQSLPGWQHSLEDTAVHMPVVASHQGVKHEVENNLDALWIHIYV